MTRHLAQVPILIRLTATFAVATLVVLAAAALFVGLRLGADLDERIDVGLDRRSEAAVAAYEAGTPMSALARTLSDREEFFVQVLTENGEVVETGGTVRGPAIRPGEAAHAARGLPLIERDLPGVDGRARMKVASVRLPSGEPGALVVGESLVDRQDALSSVVTSFVIGGVASLFLASAMGYAVARAGLAPVERMRRRAGSISMSGSRSGSPELLPLPPARDQIRRLGETLNDMLGRLRESFDRERRFVADASHEIRTPLATVRLELETALRAETPDVARREALFAAHAECLRLARLADDLLVLARLDEGQLPLRPVPVDLAVVLGGVRDQFAERASGQGRAIEVAVPARLAVTADPDRLTQLLGNLVDNALRHGAGTVRIGARPIRDGVELTVEDEGPGIPAEFADRAFERFSQADPARSVAGAGLGLALVAMIARAHGGSVDVDRDRPARLRVVLPMLGPGRPGSHPPLIHGP